MPSSSSQIPQSQLPVVSVYGNTTVRSVHVVAVVARAQHHGLAAVVVEREPLLVVDGDEIARPQPPHVHLVVGVLTRVSSMSTTRCSTSVIFVIFVSLRTVPAWIHDCFPRVHRTGIRGRSRRVREQLRQWLGGRRRVQRLPERRESGRPLGRRRRSGNRPAVGRAHDGRRVLDDERRHRDLCAQARAGRCDRPRRARREVLARVRAKREGRTFP